MLCHHRMVSIDFQPTPHMNDGESPAGRTGTEIFNSGGSFMCLDRRHSAILTALLITVLVPQFANAGIRWPWGKRPKGISKQQYYSNRSGDPVGARQRLFHGKYWPPYPRPTGPPQLPGHKYHAAHYWPYPYQCQDRHIVREISKRQINNGWVVATTLYDYHFDADSHELNRAGVMRLRWILKHAPESRRFAFVQAATSNDASQSRLTYVQNEATAMVGDGNIPPIMLRVTTPLGRPALEVDRIRRAEIDTQPSPRISNPLGAPAGGGGSGDSGQLPSGP